MKTRIESASIVMTSKIVSSVNHQEIINASCVIRKSSGTRNLMSMELVCARTGIRSLIISVYCVRSLGVLSVMKRTHVLRAPLKPGSILNLLKANAHAKSTLF